VPFALFQKNQTDYYYLYSMKKYILFSFLLFGVFHSNAATVDTVSIYSNAMHKSFKCVVIKPSLKKINRHHCQLFIYYMAMAAGIAIG
jgi:hypothetical protein